MDQPLAQNFTTAARVPDDLDATIPVRNNYRLTYHHFNTARKPCH